MAPKSPTPGTAPGSLCSPDEFVVLPRHVAIIMDGNGRWAQARGLSRIRGHEEGVKSVREVTEECTRLKIAELTLYAFSTENWRRPPSEVRALMNLLRQFLVQERKTIMSNGVRLRAIGRLDELPTIVRKELDKTVRMSENNPNLILRLALNYGGRAEIVDAVRRMIRAAAAGTLSEADVDDSVLRRYLYDPEMSDPDLLIRTGGEKRLSNFLLWQVSYTELYLTPVCWPDFRREQLWEALRAFAARTRRFGGLPPPKPRTAVSVPAGHKQ